MTQIIEKILQRNGENPYIPIGLRIVKNGREGGIKPVYQEKSQSTKPYKKQEVKRSQELWKKYSLKLKK